MEKFISFLTSENAGGLGLLLLVVGGSLVALGKYFRDEDYVPIIYILVYVVAALVLIVALLFVGGWMSKQIFN